MQYVSINLENPTMGIITGDNVGVYAGSDFVLPMHSTSKQVVLNRGQTVKLLGEEKDDYYKIAPPQGAYLWVSSQFLQTADPTVVKPARGQCRRGGQNARRPQQARWLRTRTLLRRPIWTSTTLWPSRSRSMQAKPVAEQDYTAIKTKLTEIGREEGFRTVAQRYAEYTLKQVERFELAGRVAKELDLQSKERQKIDREDR